MESAGTDAGRDIVGLHVEDVAAAGVDLVDFRGVDVEAGDVEAARRKLYGKRKADIAESDHADACTAVANLVFEVHHGSRLS